jgi:coenzyme F420-0:L-glutamate ligase/coenzyme F420-1:gamma-L-glutamate ligase
VIVHPLRSAIIKPGDSLLDIFSSALEKSRTGLKDGDIVAISSKVVAISQCRIVKLSQVKPSHRAITLARKYSLLPAFAQTVLDEADSVVGGVRKTLLTLSDGDATANAGIDRKNAPQDSLVLWPADPDETARKLREGIRRRFGRKVGVVIVDSRVTPLRLGTVGFAIGSSGFLPVEDLRGRTDLSGRQVEITFHAIADGVASAAQLVMGETSEQKPFAIIRGFPVHPSGGAGMANAKLALKDCLYMSQIVQGRPYLRKTHLS